MIANYLLIICDRCRGNDHKLPLLTTAARAHALKYLFLPTDWGTFSNFVSNRGRVSEIGRFLPISCHMSEMVTDRAKVTIDR